MISVRCEMCDQDIDRGMIEERLIAYEVYAIKRSINEHNDHDSLCFMLGEGVTGFYKMSDNDLLLEWEDAKEGFYGMFERDQLPFDLLDEDPIMGTVC
jgi:isopenicillin N synthase-like dioxygenase